MDRLRRTALGISLLLLLFAAPAARAQSVPPEERGPETHTSNVEIVGATVTGPGLEAPERWDASKAEGFVRSWLSGFLFSGANPWEDPPEGLDEMRVAVDQVLPGDREAELVVLYASDGERAWLRLPEQDFGWGVIETSRWFRAPEGAMEAFKGPGGEPASAREDADGGPPWGAAAAGVLLLLLLPLLSTGVVLRWRGRPERGGPSPSEKRLERIRR